MLYIQYCTGNSEQKKVVYTNCAGECFTENLYRKRLYESYCIGKPCRKGCTENIVQENIVQENIVQKVWYIKHCTGKIYKKYCAGKYCTEKGCSEKERMYRKVVQTKGRREEGEEGKEGI